MEPATTRFFGIRELVAHVTRYLDDGDVSRLMQTSRHLNTICSPALYYNLKAIFRRCRKNSDNLFISPESIRAFARNTHHVRQLKLEVSEVAYYAKCAMTFQDQLPTPADTIKDDREYHHHHLLSQGRPLWLAPLDLHVCTALPIPPMPPMTLLTKLDLNLDVYKGRKSCPYYLPSCRSPKATLTQVCWIMECNPNLMEIILSNVLIKDQRDVRLLAKSIFGLKRLRRLYVEASRRDDWMSIQWRSDLFFSCSPTVRCIGLDTSYMPDTWVSANMHEYMSLPCGELEPWERKEEECGLAETPRRKEPLTNLTNLLLWDEGDEPVSEENFRSMLAHSPNLTELMAPTTSGISDAQCLAEEIVRFCPMLSSIQCRDSTKNIAVYEAFVRTLAALPEQQVSAFNCETGLPFEIHNLGDVRSMFARQSSTLRDITLAGCLNIDSRVIQGILVECGALERLIVRRSVGGHRHLCITLEDAILFPWACTRIQHLELTVAIPNQPLHYPPADVEPFYNRPPPTTLSAAEQQQFDDLEVLYKQIGALTELNWLNLQATFFDPDDYYPMSLSNRTFPGMLNLRCEKTGRPGYLHHLSGLTKLRILEGSVSAEMKETKVTIGTEEVVWMERHWPALGRACFFQSNRGQGLPEAFQWWKKQRAGKAFSIGL